MRLMGLTSIYQKPNSSKPHPLHKISLYLLRGMTIDRPNQVWCADISCISMRRGFLYLVFTMGWEPEFWLFQGRLIRSYAIHD
jgi:putative transposase